jgi:hypothetical protein
MFARISIVSAVLASLALAPSIVSAAPDPTAEPPTPAELRQTTTALLQPGDVNEVLGGGSAQNIGYYIPTGGQDPYPVCITPRGGEALPDLTMTTGFFSTIGDVSEQVVVYPTAAAAQSAWNAFAKKVRQECSYSGRVDGQRTVVTNGTIAGGGVWTRRDSKADNYSNEYTAAALADNAVISVRATSPGKASTTDSQRTATDALLAVLTERYANRSTAQGVQSTMLSVAEAAMVTPAADSAWKQLSKRIKDCTAREGKLYSKTKSAWKSTAGTSAVTVDGTPGVYIRYITTQGAEAKNNRFTSRTYQLILKDGTAISWLSYSAGVPGIKKLNVNEPAANQLAVDLIDRFVNTVVTTG